MISPITGLKQSFFCAFLTIHRAVLCVYNQKAFVLFFSGTYNTPVQKDVYNLSVEYNLTGREKVILFPAHNSWM
jgi:hypothetical protein